MGAKETKRGWGEGSLRRGISPGSPPAQHCRAGLARPRFRPAPMLPVSAEGEVPSAR